MTVPGRQHERTSLAWVRTALGLVGCALLTGRLAEVRDTPWAVGAALAAALVAFGALGWAHDRYRRTEQALADEAAGRFALPAALLTIAVVSLGVLGIALIAL